MVVLIPDITNQLVAHHFKTQLHIDQTELFEFLWYKNYRSVVAMIENVEKFKKTQEEYKLWNECWDFRQWAEARP